MTKPTGETSKKELELAAKSLKTEHAAGRIVIEGGGVLGEAVNFITKRAPLHFIQIALLGFLGLHAWNYYNTAQTLVADLQAKRADASTAWAEANAANSKIGDENTRLVTARAELDKLQAEAIAARADADAQAARRNGSSMRTQTLKADLDKTQADAQKAQTEADAQNQIIEGLPLAVAQKRAEVEQLEAEAASKIQDAAFSVATFINILSTR